MDLLVVEETNEVSFCSKQPSQGAIRMQMSHEDRWKELVDYENVNNALGKVVEK